MAQHPLTTLATRPPNKEATQLLQTQSAELDLTNKQGWVTKLLWLERVATAMLQQTLRSSQAQVNSLSRW